MSKVINARWFLSIAAIAWLMTVSNAVAQVPQGLGNSYPGQEQKAGWSLKPFWKGQNKPPRTSIPKSDKNDPTSVANREMPDVAFYAQAGEIQEGQKNLDKALELYERGLQQDRRNLACLMGMARVMDAQGQHAEALTYFKNAQKYHASNPVVFNDLGLSHAGAGQKDQANRAFQRAIQLDPKGKKFRNNYASFLIDQQRNPEALAQLEAVHSEAQARYNLGYLLALKNRDREAYDQFAEAQQLDPALVVAGDWQRKLLDRIQKSAPAAVAVPPDAMLARRPAQPASSQPDFRLPVEQPAEVVISEPTIGDSAAAEAGPSFGFVPADPNGEFVAPVDQEMASRPIEEPGMEFAQPQVDSQFATATGPALPENTDLGPQYEPVVRPAPGSIPEEEYENGPRLSSRPIPDGPAYDGPRYDGRPALPKRRPSSAVQRYRSHTSETNDAPAPDELFPEWRADNGSPLSPQAKGSTGVSRARQATAGHQSAGRQPKQPQPRTARNPFSALFGR